MPAAKKPGIKCATFLKQEPLIEKLTNSINQAEDAKEKATHALDLQKEIQVLLECPDYKSNGIDCRSCHFLATVRKRTADLIILARKLV